MGKRFTEEEDDLIKQYYPIYGINYCFENLDRPLGGIQGRIKKLNLKVDRSKYDLFTPDDIEFLKKNYPNKGADFCARLLDKDRSQIVRKVTRLGIKISKDLYSDIHSTAAKKQWSNYIKPDENYSVDPLQFINIESPEISYILGLIWADGHVSKSGYSISLECVKDDMIYFETIFDNTIGHWGKYDRNRIDRRKMMNIKTGNKKLSKYLIDNDYGDKSIVSPEKILSKIPDNLKHLFYLGFFDGDGCFYKNKITPSICLSFSGSYWQDWKFIEDLLTSMEISYSKKLRSHNNESSFSSSISIYNRDGVSKLSEYFYKNNNFGLPRKRDKILEYLKTI